MHKPIVSDLKIVDYEACLKLQRAVHGAHVEGVLPDTLLLVEHPHVLTFGKRGQQENVLVSESTLQQMGVTCAHVERGGDVTYHGPGQVLAYPIFALEKKGIGVLDFVGKLEDVMIGVLKDYQIKGERDDRNRGVWVRGRKIGFIGIAVRKGITLHGLSMNISPELSFFKIIHSCGLKEVGITSMTEILKKPVSMADIKARFIFHFQKVFETDLVKISPENLKDKLDQYHDK